MIALSSILLSNHMAGSIHGEMPRMADLVIEEFLRWKSDAALHHEVTLEALNTMD